MKNLLVALMVAVTIMSCSPEDKANEVCGIVESFSERCIDGECTWYVLLSENDWSEVDYDTFESASNSYGQRMCIQFIPVFIE